MKGGLAAVLEAVDRLTRRGVKLRGQLVVVGTASAETRRLSVGAGPSTITPS